MNRHLASVLAATALSAVVYGAPASAQSRTPWQMHHGLEITESNPLGLVPFSCTPSRNGDPCEYDVATIPPVGDPAWGPAPDGEIIDFLVYPSNVCSAPVTCMAYGDFTYFQSFVRIPADFVVTDFTIVFDGMDDGSRVSIYNSSYPNGIVIPGSYVYHNEWGTANLGAYVRAGEVNRVVVTQVDDCCIHNNMREAWVQLNGRPVELVMGAPPELTMCNMPRYSNRSLQKICAWTRATEEGVSLANVSLTINDGAPIRLSPDESGGYAVTWMNLPEGTHDIRVTATDEHGRATLQQKTVTVDLTPPVLSVLAPAQDAVCASPVVDVTTHVQDATPTQVTTQWVQSSSVESGTGTITHTVDLVNRGWNSVLISATDAAGNTSELDYSVNVAE
ncbi:hypothetical protein HPC49_17130 [Pyxidicoccus fallax]|uniref:HYR domain-containing protein n=1 Tax=Pyxidicoccus fallax TaxID=394095 RepID=A0A848LXN9_9BACT|nr:hypothetical protein [Pyxidicoccus fallax]NMO22835.1 hypothetical protein [Pyxidicoccus fallax]NPC79940.1 hypothetical protein [Pyxidicoccus fallax]